MIRALIGATNAMVGTFVFLGLAALMQAQTCSNASFSGTWFCAASGTAAESPGPGPYGQLTRLISDGNGNLSLRVTENMNGALSSASATGTYTMNADCSGMLTGGAGSSGNATFAFQLAQGGRELLLSSTDPYLVLTGVAYRAAAQGTSQCGNGSLTGKYGWLQSSLRLVPSLYPLGQGLLGEMLFDGEGGLSFKGTRNPTETGLSGVGTYSIAGDCSGTAVLPVPGYTVNLQLAVVEGGNVVLMDNDPNSFFFGIMHPVSALSVLPQVAFGGGWYSALYFTNMNDAAVSFPVNFTANNGTPLSVPALSGPSTTVNVPAQGSAIVEAPNSGSLTEGYATFTLPPGVSGYGVFRQSASGQPDQEAVVPFATANAVSSTLVWDETNFTTAVAIVNTGSVAATIYITLWDNSGNVVGTSTMNLPAGQKTEAVLRSLLGLSGMAGLRGKARFSATSGNVAVLGLRFGATAFTSIPAQQ